MPRPDTEYGSDAQFLTEEDKVRLADAGLLYEVEAKPEADASVEAASPKGPAPQPTPSP